MASTQAIEQQFRETVSEKIRILPEGRNRFQVFTPFHFNDCDHFVVVLKREADAWVLSDEGNTFMHLSYEIDEKDLQKGTRAKVIGNALEAFSIEERSGELILRVADDQFGDALFDFVQALLKISDVSFLSRERVRSTFMDDFRALIEQTVTTERRSFDWNDPERDPSRRYTVDCRVNGLRRPLFVFALPSDDKVRDATITLGQFERWGVPFRSLGIFEDQEQIGRKVLARFSDVCEKQFSSLTDPDRITRYVQLEIEDARART